MKLIKLIWDFKGPSSNKTAEHFKSHLDQFLKIENKTFSDLGLEIVNDSYSFVFVITSIDDLNFFKEKLKPNRGQKVN
ncbi:hypothetical protein N9I49_01320 [Flavobacteriaceae bacterium]|jgi:hypothetical protein|nr:hypothetical protein [Flavobacteriaceae bacterium]|tara:strand:- start:1533 stop:1766 length:234 start_codon:yes stop_codon:yes gene_type:complete